VPDACELTRAAELAVARLHHDDESGLAGYLAVRAAVLEAVCSGGPREPAEALLAVDRAVLDAIDLARGRLRAAIVEIVDARRALDAYHGAPLAERVVERLG